MSIAKIIQPHRFKIPIIISFQMEAIDTSMTYKTKFFTLVYKNGHNAYLVELPDLKSLFRTRRDLMDEVTGQFYAIYGNSYQRMCTIPRLLCTWEPGQLIDELVVTRCTFSYIGPTGPAPA